MEILRRYLSRWIMAPISSGGHGVTNVLLLGFLLEFLPYGAGQQGSSADPNNNGPAPNSPIEVVILAMFIMFFVMALSSILSRRYAYRSPPVTTGAVAGGGGGVWVRRATRGLDAQVIESFPAFLFSDVKGLKIGKGGVECAVCLSEFQDAEMLRLMPPCSHVFHAKCIDVWLSSHTTCPVCRASWNSNPSESCPSSAVDLNAIANPGMDVETANAGRRNLEPSDVSLIDSVTWSDNNWTRRSRSTGLSSWRITGILFPRSHSTGHSLVQQTAENLDRFTLQLPGEVRRQLMKTSMLIRTRSSHLALPQARSSRRGYRSGSVGSVRNAFLAGRQHGRRAISLSLSFSFRNGSVRSSSSSSDPAAAAVAPPKGLLRSIKSPFEKAFKDKDGEMGERSFERLQPDGRV